jgi:hypothetical protein
MIEEGLEEILYVLTTISHIAIKERTYMPFKRFDCRMMIKYECQ